MTVDLYDKKKKKCGTLTFKTKFIYVKVENKRPVISSASISLWKGMSSTINMENARTEGMRANINLKL
jgi:hypothetical protein